jgi:hypothetical protein
MPRYRLRDECLLVDAYVYDETNKKPSGEKKPDPLKCAHINDQSTNPPTYLKLNDGAAFIARFIALRVKTELISEILKSEYGDKIHDPVGDVNKVVAMLRPYLVRIDKENIEDPIPEDPSPYERPYEVPNHKGQGQHSGHYDLDFRVNWFPIGGYKLPL